MTCLFLSAPRQLLAALVLGATAITVGGCSNTVTGGPVQQSLARQASGSLPTYSTFYKIEDTNGSNFVVTGIDKAQTIVGTYCASSPCPVSSPITQSFIGNETKTNTGQYTLVGDNFPQPVDNTTTYNPTPTTSTGLVAINPGTTTTLTFEAGWVSYPGDFFYTLGLLNNQGLWSALHDGIGETGGCSTKESCCKRMELSGINDVHDGVNYDAVGYYTRNVPCTVLVKQAFKAVLFGPGRQYKEINLSGYNSSAATGIDDAGDIVGWAALNGSTSDTVAWYIKGTAAAQKITIPVTGTTSAQALGINSAHDIVGSYSVGFVTHGFFCTAYCNGTTSSFETVDNPCGGCTNTVVYGINDRDDICGSYVGGEGNQHGFVAFPTTGPWRRRAAQSHSARSLQGYSAGTSH